MTDRSSQTLHYGQPLLLFWRPLAQTDPPGDSRKTEPKDTTTCLASARLTAITLLFLSKGCNRGKKQEARRPCLSLGRHRPGSGTWSLVGYLQAPRHGSAASEGQCRAHPTASQLCQGHEDASTRGWQRNRQGTGCRYCPNQLSGRGWGPPGVART